MTVSASLKQVAKASNSDCEPRVAMRLHDRDHLPSVAARAALSTAAISTGWWP